VQEILDPRFRGDDGWTLEGAKEPFSDKLAIGAYLKKPGIGDFLTAQPLRAAL